MKKIISVLIILLFATSAFAIENPWNTKLPFKNAIIDSKMSGSMNGDKTLYIKDYGQTRAEYSTASMKMFGMTQEQKEVIITTPDWIYTADLSENTGTKQSNIKKFLAQEFNSLSKNDQKKVADNAEKQGFSTFEGMGGKLQKNATKILGYNCDRVIMSGLTSYTISGTDIVLKMSGNTMGMKMNQAATSVKKESGPSSKFKVPSNINFEYDQQADKMLQDQAKIIIQNLLEGNNSSQMSNSANSSQTYSQPAASSEKSQAGAALSQDAKDVGQAARQETKDATIDEVKEGVRSVFKSLFD